ncbi:MAG: hypothetical protein ACLFS5_01745, partial [Spirochaetaceae bacterium]
MGIYRWKEGTRFSADAETVAEEINTLEQKTPHGVLLLAEDEGTELHKCFTWDDAAAAHKYRLEEARKVLRSVIVVEEEAPEPIQYRAWEVISVPSESEEGESHNEYVSVPDVLSDDDTWKQVKKEITTAIAEQKRKLKVYEYLRKESAQAAQQHLELA